MTSEARSPSTTTEAKRSLRLSLSLTDVLFLAVLVLLVCAASSAWPGGTFDATPGTPPVTPLVPLAFSCVLCSLLATCPFGSYRSSVISTWRRSNMLETRTTALLFPTMRSNIV